MVEEGLVYSRLNYCICTTIPVQSCSLVFTYFPIFILSILVLFLYIYYHAKYYVRVYI